MDDYEVSAYHPHVMGEDGNPRRDVIKGGLSLDDATALAQEHAKAKPSAMYDLCITQTAASGEVEIIDTIYRFARPR